MYTVTKSRGDILTHPTLAVSSHPSERQASPATPPLHKTQNSQIDKGITSGEPDWGDGLGGALAVSVRTGMGPSIYLNVR